jgi:hypothetical protein
MNTYQITQEGNAFKNYTLAIEAQINASQSLTQEVGSTHEAGTPEFDAEMQLAVDNEENYYKTIALYSTQDTNRNGTYTYAPIENSANYTLSYTWTVENAVMNLTTETNTDLLGTDLDAHLQNVTDQAVANYKSLIFMTDL